MNAETTLRLSNQFLMNTIDRHPWLAIERGLGCRVWDKKGMSYLEFWADEGVISLGHGHPMVMALIEQFKLMDGAGGVLGSVIPYQLPNIYANPYTAGAAKALCELMQMDRVFFANSGAEANEAAVKLARKYQYDKGDYHKTNIVTITGGFHGRTYAMLGIADGPGYHRRGFGPFPAWMKERFRTVNDIVPETTAAVFMATALGQHDVGTYSQGFFDDLNGFCDNHGILLMFDEIQVGMGRCGAPALWMKYGCRPDVFTLGKGLGAGFPVSACLARGDAADVFTPGTHFNTFGGSPFVCAMVEFMCEYVGSEENLEHVDDMGRILMDRMADLECMTNVRGLGLLCMADFTPGWPAYMFRDMCQERGLLLGIFREDNIKISPSFCVTQVEIDEAYVIMKDVENVIFAHIEK